VGRKGRDYLRRRGYPVLSAHTDLPGEASLDLARTLAKELIERYVSGEVDRVEIVYAHFVNALVRRTNIDVFLPIGADTVKAGRADGGTIFEPSAEAIVRELLPRYTTARLYAAMPDALASGQGERMNVMGSAGKKKDKHVDALTLTRNRLRQGGDHEGRSPRLVGGAEALR
jgi:F-type H+-transporting ATPase subunit gamma